MKKVTLFVIVIGLMAITSVLIAGDKDYPQFKFGGRITMELVSENNMTDFTDFDEDTGVGNDYEAYGQARVDLNFKSMINENICAVISTRFENGNGDKWLRFGKNYTNTDNDGDGKPDDDGSKMQDTSPKLQEAYIGFKKLFVNGLSAELGRKAYVYGTGLVMGDLDKVDGWRIGYKNDVFYGNMHYMIREQHPHYAQIEDPHTYWIWGINGGMDNLANMVDFNVYYWLNYMPVDDPEDAKKATSWMINVIGARGEFDLMDGMITPYVEIAGQMGVFEKGYAKPNTAPQEYDDVTYSGYLFDIGTGFDKEVGSMAIDANVEILMVSGDDAETLDEEEGWKGNGLGNREMGYLLYNVAMPENANGDECGLFMFNLGGGITVIEDLRIGLDFFMFNDNSANYKDANNKEYSGENMANEIDLNIDYEMAKKTTLYCMLGLIMPNKDYPGMGEDTATGFIVGAQTKW